jgi:hypothetical protein
MEPEIQAIGTEESKEELSVTEAQREVVASTYGINIEAHEGEFNPYQVKFLCYGESGSGKTVFSSTWPKPIFLDIDKGMASIKRKVHRVSIDSWAMLDNAVLFLEKTKHPFKTVVIDSLNELQSLTMRNIVTAFPQIRRAYTDLPSQSDYGKMLDDADKMIRRLKGLSINVVFICNVAPQEYETDVVQPQLVGKHSARTLSRMMDVIGYLYKTEGGNPQEGGKQRIMVFDASRYVTKDRSGVLPPTVQDPTYKLLFAYWRARWKQPTIEGEK